MGRILIARHGEEGRQIGIHGGRGSVRKGREVGKHGSPLLCPGLSSNKAMVLKIGVWAICPRPRRNQVVRLEKERSF